MHLYVSIESNSSFLFLSFFFFSIKVIGREEEGSRKGKQKFKGTGSFIMKETIYDE